MFHTRFLPDVLPQMLPNMFCLQLTQAGIVEIEQVAGMAVAVAPEDDAAPANANGQVRGMCVHY